MRIITYSDLHLEFGSGWMLPPDANGDVMILAGDIITLRDCDPLDQLLQKWKKPVLYATGNHEYYTQRPMNEEDERFRAWLKAKHPHVKLLLDEEVSIGGVNFFGGTMWTDFNGGDERAMETAQDQMNDFRLPKPKVNFGHVLLRRTPPGEKSGVPVSSVLLTLITGCGKSARSQMTSEQPKANCADTMERVSPRR
jgi:Calcineurin-like phosphoesterase